MESSMNDWKNLKIEHQIIFSDDVTACMLNLPRHGRWSPGKLWSCNLCTTKV